LGIVTGSVVDEVPDVGTSGEEDNIVTGTFSDDALDAEAVVLAVWAA
jgi:hypothetical protein